MLATPCWWGPARPKQLSISSVSRLDQPNYYAHFYFKESICPMSMKLSVKVCNRCYYFAKIFCMTFCSRDPKLNVYILYSKMGNIYTSKIKVFGLCHMSPPRRLRVKHFDLLKGNVRVRLAIEKEKRRILYKSVKLVSKKEVEWLVLTLLM